MWSNSAEVFFSQMASAKRTFLFVVLVLVGVGHRRVFAQYHVYWGDVHGHTSLSDGKGTLDDYFIYARDVAKLDFVIVTDHDFGHTAPWRMPKEAWQETQDKADQYTVPGRFVAIAGYEWTSQPKYWKGVGTNQVSERLFDGPPKFYNHKIVYFPAHVDYLFSAKDVATHTPDTLAAAVLKHGGLIHNAHPSSGHEGRDQFDYQPEFESVITNSEIFPDEQLYEGKTYQLKVERLLREFLNHGRKTGFVKGTDSHEGHPAARTAVLATELTREAIFDALRHRRNYAVSNARIVLDFRINRHVMGEQIKIADKPHIEATVVGTKAIDELAVIRDGVILRSVRPENDKAQLEFVDSTFAGNSYYYLRISQRDKDAHANPSRAWSSPIWVTKNRIGSH